MLRAAAGYVRDNPAEIGRAFRSAMGLRMGVPLDALRWLAAEAEESGKATDVVIESRPPGIRMAATVDLMRTTVRASAVVFVERVLLTSEELRIEVRLENVTLDLAEESTSPVAMLIKSGALDLSKPGNLVQHMADLPPVLVEARDNRIVLDLMRHPKLGRNRRVRQAVSVLTSLVTVHGMETDEQHLDVTFRALPQGVFSAARQVRANLIGPSLRRVRLLMPGARP